MGDFGRCSEEISGGSEAEVRSRFFAGDLRQDPRFLRNLTWEQLQIRKVHFFCVQPDCRDTIFEKKGKGTDPISPCEKDPSSVIFSFWLSFNGRQQQLTRLADLQ